MPNRCAQNFVTKTYLEIRRYDTEKKATQRTNIYVYYDTISILSVFVDGTKQRPKCTKGINKCCKTTNIHSTTDNNTSPFTTNLFDAAPKNGNNSNNDNGNTFLINFETTSQRDSENDGDIFSKQDAVLENSNKTQRLSTNVVSRTYDNHKYLKNEIKQPSVNKNIQYPCYYKYCTYTIDETADLSFNEKKIK